MTPEHSPPGPEADAVEPVQPVEPVETVDDVIDPDVVDADLTEVVDGEVVDDQVGNDADQQDAEMTTEAVNDVPTEEPAAADGQPHPDAVLAAERLVDLQRLQAEYVNYKRRVDRDRAVVQQRAIADVIESMLPVLDDIHAAREHGDLVEGPFAAIADKLETSLGRFGLARFGTPGEAFDPMEHEALMHVAWPEDADAGDATATTIVQVLQPGYRAGERIIRPARVSVADPT